MDLRRAEQLGEELIAEHGLAGWRLRFDGAKRRAGMCRYGHHVISLSAPLTRLHDEAEVRETLLHEIAHALAGLGAGHGPEWQRVARTIGSSGDRCVSVVKRGRASYHVRVPEGLLRVVFAGVEAA